MNSQQLDLFLPQSFSPAERMPARHPLNDRVSELVIAEFESGDRADVFYDFADRRWRFYGYPGIPPQPVRWRPRA